MVTVPPAPGLPVTIPVEEPMVAILVLLLHQVPPGVASLSTVVSPAHTLVVPVIADGNGFTVTIVLLEHPVEISVKVIIEVPVGPTDETIPVFTIGIGPGTTVAIVVFELLHVPDGIASLSMVVKPEHIEVIPVIAGGRGLTVTIVEAAQPVPMSVYVIVVMPPGLVGVPPVTTPEKGVTVATILVLLLHVPLGVPSLSVVVWPAQMVVLPDITVGNAFTVMVSTLAQPVGSI
jgi:hypothetical protein